MKELNSASRASRYGMAVASVAAALLARMAMQPLLGYRIPYATFYVAIGFVAAYGGTGPGVLATILGGLACAYLFVPPGHSFLIVGVDNQVGFVVYLTVSVLLVWLGYSQRRARLELQAEVWQREQAEAAERLQRQWFEVTLASIGDGVIVADAAGRVSFLNRTASEITGWPEAEARGQAIDSVFQIRDEYTGAPAQSPVGQALRERRVVALSNHTLLVSRTGRRFPIDDSVAPILSNEGVLLGAVLVFRDATEVRARAAELRERDRMVEFSHDAVIIADAGRRILFWNRGAEELYGYTAGEARGKVIHELLQTRNSGSTAAIDRVLHEQGRWDGELIHTRKDGTELVCESRHVLRRDAQNEIIGILEINRDISDRKRAEEELKQAAAAAEEGRRTLEALMDHIPEGITIADAPEVHIRAVSRYGIALAGRPAEALVHIPLERQPSAWGYYHADGKTLAQPHELPLARAIEQGEVITDEEWLLRRPDGTTVRVLCNAGPIRDAGGAITGGLVAWRDMTERHRLEQKLREAAKLESLGVLAGGIAHDFNNLLTGIMGHASVLADEIAPGTAAADSANAILKTAERAARLTQQMLAYSGRGRFIIEPVHLSRWIHETAALLHASIAKNVDMKLQLADDLPLVEADTAQLQQVVMNLIVNGAEAIGQAPGTLRVATYAQQVDVAYIRGLGAENELQPGWYVVLEVSDTGCGMDAATVSRIFDPFFTTKFLGRGLGLAAVQGIVRGHKGTIRVYTAPGQGTTFRVLLPATAETLTASAEPEQPVSEGVHSGSGSVLVVDDEQVVLSTARSALRMLGYDVLLAEDGKRGIELFREAHENIVLVILDLTMPGLSGEETMRALRAIRPDVPILLSSGFSEAEAMSRFDGHGPSGFLQKPYTVRMLAQKVRSVLPSNRPA